MTDDAHDPAAQPASPALSALPVGTRFGELEVLGTLGVGGFGIVYLARDHALERDVAIKEYMPGQFAVREGPTQVVVRAPSLQETFALGLDSFVNEARLLARFDHPSLLKVYRFWEAHGTAYMAMPRLSGQNLRQARLAQPTPPAEAWVRRIFDAVLDGLAVLHAQQVWHRDIAPDNIFLPHDGSAPILLDFGAARQAIGDRTQLFTAILKPRFAPIEQYAEAANLRQGPWTDFYALAAVMHELLTGHPPPPATARAMGDELQPLALPGYSPALLAGLHWALRVAPHQRPASAAAWREVIDGRAPVPEATPRPGPATPPASVPAPPDPPARGRPQRLDIEFADTVQFAPSELDALNAPAAAPSGERAAPARRRPVGLLVAAGLLAVLMLVLFARQLKRPGPAAAAETPVAAADVASAPASAPAVVAAPVPLTEPAASVPVAAPVPVPVAVAASGAARPPARREPRPIITEKAGEFRPVSGSPSLPPNDPAPASAAAAGARGASAAGPAEPRTPAEACSGRTLFARAWCIDRQCEKPQFQNDAECVKLRDIRSSRNNNNP